jgi:hypothetical protein
MDAPGTPLWTPNMDSCVNFSSAASQFTCGTYCSDNKSVNVLQIRIAGPRWTTQFDWRRCRAGCSFAQLVTQQPERLPAQTHFSNSIPDHKLEQDFQVNTRISL